MSALVIAEHDNASIKGATLNTVTAAAQLGEVHVLVAGLNAAGLVAKDLPSLKGSDPRKLALAELLWKRTTVSQEWISQKLSMRSAPNVSQQLRRFNRAKIWVDLK